MDAELESSGRVRFSADSDSEVTRGLAAVLVTALSGLTPAQVLEVSFPNGQFICVGLPALFPPYIFSSSLVFKESSAVHMSYGQASRAVSFPVSDV